MIDEFVLRKLYAGVLDGKDRFSIADLAEQYRSEQIPDAIFVDMNKLEKIFFRFTDAQRRRLISPPLIAIDQQSGVLSVGDRRFFLVLRTVTVDDFDDLMDRTAPTRQPSPRRSAEVSIELSDTDKAKFLAEQVKLAENRLVSGASQTPDAAREAPDGDASRRAADPLDEYDDSDWEEESDEEGTGEDGSDDDGHDDDGSDQDESDAVGSDDETRNCAGSGDTIPATPSAPSSHGCG
jgi:hypothetical protein